MYWELVLPSGTVNFSERWPTCDDLKLAIPSQIVGLTVYTCNGASVLHAQDLVGITQNRADRGERITSVRQVNSPYPGTESSCVEVDGSGGSSSPESTDTAQFAGVFGVALASVVGFYLLSLKIALVLGVVRRA
jgi:hypothetical protein